MKSNNQERLKRIRQYTGVLHVHSTFSDGTRPIPEIAQIANELDLRFLLITDHNTLRGKHEGFEGWYGNVLVGVGNEINDAEDKNHYLAFDIDQEFGPQVPAREYVRAVRKAGGLGIVAHPDESRRHISRYPPYPWTLWDLPEFDGIEIWNQMSEWMEGLTHWNKFWRIWHPRRSIVAPKEQTLKRWDQLNQHRRVVGVGGVDAHGFLHKLWGPFSIRVFRYKISFRTIRTHILTETELKPELDYKEALKAVYQALRMARCFISHAFLGNAEGFTFYAQNENELALMGETLLLTDKTQIVVTVPQKAQITLMANGKKVSTVNDSQMKFNVNEPGAYRVEVWTEGRPWIYSNHIRIVTR